MVACGQTEDETSAAKDSEKQTLEETESENLSQSEWMEQQEGVEAKAEVTDIKYYKWLDESVDTETITVYAEIKNTGDIDIMAGDAKLTFLDSDGSVVSATSDGGTITPEFIKKGSVGYVAMEVYDDISKYEDLDKVEIEISPLPYHGEVVEFKTKDTNLNVGKWGDTNSEISVTGFFENESDIDFNNEETTAIMGLYDENDNFLAAESMYMGQEFSIDANNETSFEVGGGSPLPPEIGEKVDHAEVKAIGTKFE